MLRYVQVAPRLTFVIHEEYMEYVSSLAYDTIREEANDRDSVINKMVNAGIDKGIANWAIL